MGSAMREAASANLKKDKKPKGFIASAKEVYNLIFPPPPPAKQGTMTNRDMRKQMDLLDKENF